MRYPLTLILTLLISLSAHGQTVEQRIAALEQRVSAIEQGGVAVDVPPANAQAVIAVKALSAHHAIHLAVDETVAKQLPVVQWLSEDGERRGFNAAFVKGEASLVVCKINGKPTAVYALSWPDEPAATPLAPGADIAKLKAGVYQLQTGDYQATGIASLQDVTLLGAGIDKTVIRYTGNAKLGYCWLSGSRMVLRDLTLVSNYVYKVAPSGITQNARREAVSGIQPGDDSTFVNVKMVGWNEGWNTNNHPSRILWLGCIVRENIGNGWWNEASQACLYDSDIDNSKLEHGARGGGYSYWAINGCRLWNIDNRATDKDDDAKGGLVLQWGTYAYAWDNELSSVGLWPLPATAGGKLTEFTDYGVVDPQKTIGLRGVEIGGGLRHARIEVPVISWRHDDGRAIEDVIVPKGSTVPAWAVRTAPGN